MKPGKDYTGIGIGAIIKNEEGKFFLAKRRKDVRNEPGKWEFPGGGLEFGEGFEESIIREVKEEHDITIDPFKRIAIHNSSFENEHWVSLSYLARIVDGEPKIMEPNKCEEVGWFSVDEIKNLDLTTPTAQDLEILETLNEE
jgi:mutator protein MutT